MKKISFLIIMIIFLSGCYDEVPTGIDLSSIQKDNTRPSCSIFSPANYSDHVAGSSISIQVNASDEDNNLSNVKIYLDDNLQTTLSSSPFIFSLNTTNLSTGSHTIQAIATDSQNATSPSSYVNVTITASSGNNPPECVITSPANNSSSTVGSTVTILANATDSDGSIQEVRFYVDEALKSTDQNEPYAYTWNTTGLTSGNHTIKVIAKDNLNFETEKSITIVLTSGGTNIPVTGVSLNFATANLSVNQTKLLTAAIIPSGASNQTVFWSSSNSNVATVSDGLVTAKTPGNATITVRTDDGGFTAVCDIVVSSFVYVEGGTFSMGGASEATIHTVTLNSFFINTFETTQSDWVTIMGTNPSYFTGDLNKPVDQVNFYAILVYCNKKSITEGLLPCYTINGNTNPGLWGSIPLNSSNQIWNGVICNWSANGYRLPTEAEWEYAAKGGKLSQNYTYSGSNVISSVAWYNMNSSQSTHSVGQKSANELGIKDMSGNVYEWCWDWYSSYSSSSQNNPTGALNGDTRVLRGGCYTTGIENYCSNVARSSNYPYQRFDFYGFRICRSY